MEDIDILKIAIERLSENFNKFIGACLDENGNAKTPTRQDIMSARGCLPHRCSLALTRQHNP